MKFALVKLTFCCWVWPAPQGVRQFRGTKAPLMFSVAYAAAAKQPASSSARKKSQPVPMWGVSRPEQTQPGDGKTCPDCAKWLVSASPLFLSREEHGDGRQPTPKG